MTRGKNVEPTISQLLARARELGLTVKRSNVVVNRHRAFTIVGYHSLFSKDGLRRVLDEF